MPRLRSVAVVALLWVAAFAASSAPDGFGGPRRAAMPVVVGTVAHQARTSALADDPRNGKRWAWIVDPGEGTGKRWS